jgi:hypothetical protein
MVFDKRRESLRQCVFLQIQTELWQSSKHNPSCFDVRQTYEAYK